VAVYFWLPTDILIVFGIVVTKLDIILLYTVIPPNLHTMT